MRRLLLRPAAVRGPRVRRADLSVGEWVQENGSIEALRRLAACSARAAALLPGCEMLKERVGSRPGCHTPRGSPAGPAGCGSGLWLDSVPHVYGM